MRLLAILLLLVTSVTAWAIEIPSPVLRPLSRFMLLYTDEGAAIVKLIAGEAAIEEKGLLAFERKLNTPEWEGRKQEIINRIDRAELRISVAEGASMDDALDNLSAVAREVLELDPARFEFAREISSYQVTREQFMARHQDGNRFGRDFSGQDLREHDFGADPDLRFTRWQDAQVDDLSGADLRGADLRGLATEQVSVRDAIYDQFTALPFMQKEAIARGMIYTPSTPPEGFLLRNLPEKAVKTARAAAPRGTEKVPQKMLKTMAKEFPKTTAGVELFRKPRRLELHGSQLALFEAGVVTSIASDAPHRKLMLNLLEELDGYGGELRRLVAINPSTSTIRKHQAAYFRMEGRKPVIAVGHDCDLPTLLHERQHLRDWQELYKKYQDLGHSDLGAHRMANREFDSPEFRAETERRAVAVQLEELDKIEDAAGIPLAERSARAEGRRALYLKTYPELQAIDTALFSRSVGELRADAELLGQVESDTRKIIRAALDHRRYLYTELSYKSAAEFTPDELLRETMPTQSARFSERRIYDAFRDFYVRLLPEEVQALAQDRFKTAVLKNPGL